MAVKNKRLFELRLGKAGLIVFVIGMSLLLFSGFLIGVVVGKHMEAYPEQYAFGMMGLVRDRLIAASPKAVKKDAADVEDETFNLTFYDTLGGKKERQVDPPVKTPKKEAPAAGTRGDDAKSKAPDFSAGQVVPPIGTPKKEAPAATPGQVAGQRTLPAFTPEGGQKKQPPLAEGLAGAAGTQGPPPMQSMAAPQMKKTPPAGSAGFEIQVAAYRDERQAQRMVKRFAAIGFSPHVVMKDLSEKGIWFRVIVGGFESREKAQEASERIVAKFRGIKCVIRPSGKS